MFQSKKKKNSVIPVVYGLQNLLSITNCPDTNNRSFYENLTDLKIFALKIILQNLLLLNNDAMVFEFFKHVVNL